MTDAHEAVEFGNDRSREGRAYVGLETQRPLSDLATRRTTPALFGLYSLMTLFGHALHPEGSIPVAQAAWYRKQSATFRSGAGGSSATPVGQFVFSHISF